MLLYPFQRQKVTQIIYNLKYIKISYGVLMMTTIIRIAVRKQIAYIIVLLKCSIIRISRKIFSSFKAIQCTLSNRLWLSASLCIVDFKALLSKKLTICMCFELLWFIDYEEKDKFLRHFTSRIVISHENPTIWLLLFEFTSVLYLLLQRGVYLCFIKNTLYFRKTT